MRYIYLLIALVLSIQTTNAQISRNTVSMKEALYGEWINENEKITRLDEFGNIIIGVGDENIFGKYKITKQADNKFEIRCTGIKDLDGHLEVKFTLSDDKLIAISTLKVIGRGKSHTYNLIGKLLYKGKGYEDPSPDVDKFLKDLIQRIETNNNNLLLELVDYPVENIHEGEYDEKDKYSDKYYCTLLNGLNEPELLYLLKAIVKDFNNSYKHKKSSNLENKEFMVKIDATENQITITYYRAADTTFLIFELINGIYKFKRYGGYENY